MSLLYVPFYNRRFLSLLRMSLRRVRATMSSRITVPLTFVFVDCSNTERLLFQKLLFFSVSSTDWNTLYNIINNTTRNYCFMFSFEWAFLKNLSTDSKIGTTIKSIQKQNHRKVVLKPFHLDGHPWGLQPQTCKIKGSFGTYYLILFHLKKVTLKIHLHTQSFDPQCTA